jgi:hypothetical protein
MKRLTLTLILLLSIMSTAFSQSAKAITLTGKILDAETGEVLVGATVLLKGTKTGAQTDFNGMFEFNIKTNDTVGIVVFSYIGFEELEMPIKAFKRSTDKNVFIAFVVLSSNPAIMESVEIKGSRVSDTGRRAPLTVESMDKLAIKSTAAVSFYEGLSAAKTVEVSSSSVSFAPIAMDVDKTTEKRDVLKATTFAEDLIAIPEVHNFLKDVEKANTKAKKALIDEDDDIEPEPSAGQLTAGEWNDLKNWEFWKKSLDETFKSYANDWKMNLTQRYSLILRGSNEQPISDAIVQLIGADGLVIWTARTDNTGLAELFADVLGATKPAKIGVQYAGKTYNLDKIRKVETGANELKIPVACGFSPTVDIAFVVDATGSMGDEIAYLKAELADVIRQVKRDNQQLSVRLGSVFYRDFGDAYLTRTFPFDKSLKKNIEFIKAQQAGGGGDTPEAVPEGLEAAIDSMAWSENAVTRLLFLVLDAPPHLNAENVVKLQRLTAKAAEKGIRIIPIAASGVDQNTEYLMKAFAVATGGTYTFLTDDSGIGGTHLKATTEKHEIELLNALLVRLIKQYGAYEACNDLVAEAMTGGDTKFGLNFRVYPNPVRDILNLELKTAVTDVFITNAQGQTVRKLGIITEGGQTIDVSDLSSGVYFVHFKKDGVVCTKKISVVK